jgi:esterase/lipase
MQQTEDGGKTRALRRLELRSIKDSVKFRKQEIDQLKKKTEVDKLAEEFNVTLIGLQKALTEATDNETKARIKALIAIEKNDEALAKKAAAELLAAEAAKRLAATYDQALESVKLMNARIAAFIATQGLDLIRLVV